MKGAITINECMGGWGIRWGAPMGAIVVHGVLGRATRDDGWVRSCISGRSDATAAEAAAEHAAS